MKGNIVKNTNLLCLEKFLPVFMFLISSAGADFIDEPQFGYSVNLPENWVVNHHFIVC